MRSLSSFLTNDFNCNDCNSGNQLFLQFINFFLYLDLVRESKGPLVRLDRAGKFGILLRMKIA
jgi:hypothetical protein